MDWYYEKNTKREGPVSLAELEQLHSAGEVFANTLVWGQGMADWIPYREAFPNSPSVVPPPMTFSCPTCGVASNPAELIPSGREQLCPACKDLYLQGISEGADDFKLLRPGSGTGGQLPAKELRAKARARLKGRWLMGALATFVFFLIIQAGGFVPLIGFVITILISGPLLIGYADYFLKVNRSQPADIGVIFSGFKRFGQGLGLYFVTTVIITLSVFLAMIPGVAFFVLVGVFSTRNVDSSSPEVALGLEFGPILILIPALLISCFMYLRYSLVYFIAADEPNAGVLSTIRKSTQLTSGRKRKLLWLYLTFTGWFLLGALALGIGLLWTSAYMMAATAAFYDDLKEEA